MACTTERRTEARKSLGSLSIDGITLIIKVLLGK